MSTNHLRKLPLIALSSASLLPLACGDDEARETASDSAASVTVTVPTLPMGGTTEGPLTTSGAPTTTADSDSVGSLATTEGTSLAPTDTSDSDGPTGDPTTLPGTTTDDPPALHCSDDLHNVLDQDDAIVESCPSDQACLDAACMPVCSVIAALAGTVGCDFWAPTPPFTFNGAGTGLDGPCFAVFLANAWTGPANISLSYGGQPIDVAQYAKIPKSDGNVTTYDPLPPGGLPPDEVAILFLAHKPGVFNGNSLECPVPPALLQDTAVSGTGLGQAFHITTDAPVSAYDINPYGGASTYLPSASLLFPATSWGTNHMSISPAPNTDPMFALIVAREDNTTIKVAPSVDLPGGGGQPPAPAGQTTQYVLNAGQSLQWAQGVFDSSGSIFDSDKPIGLWTGNTYLGVQSASSGPGGHDASHQQIVPVKAMGSEYVGPGVVTRLGSLAPESIPYRMVGAIDGTTLTWDPAPPNGAPTSLAAGQTAQFETTSFFTVRSQDPDHPFLFSQYMPGTSGSCDRPGCSSPGCQLGDEEWVSLLSPKQFQNRYIFFTDPTYPTTNLVIIRRKDVAFADVTVECLGVVTGWTPVGAEGLYEVAHVDLERANVPVANCGTSRHLAESDGPFGIVVWGTDYAASYGYPAGSDISKINEVVLPTPG